MGNYGLKISQDGYDVKTASDTELVFSSKYGTNASMCIAVSGTASDTSASDITITVNHSLGVTPFVLVYYVTGDNSSNWQWIPGGSSFLLGSDYPAPTFMDIYDDKVIVKFLVVGGTKSVTIKYYLFNVSI